jgi:CDP-2,3-bis-(O-geranylgeranyl)-sn-glycerol synthase
MDGIWLALRLLVLVGVANTAPIAAKRILGTRWNGPLDGGLQWTDGRPLLGPSKTFRGVLASFAACIAGAPLLDFPMATGALVALGAMAGDAFASFTKRRLGIRSSGRAFGLDQVPEALLPLLLVQRTLGLQLWQVAALTLVFLLAEPPAAWLAWRMGLRDEPY